MKDTEIRNLIFKLQKSTFNAPRFCLYKNCQERAINSHILQKRGIISSIAESQHVYEIALNAFKGDFFEFKKKGIGDALSFPGFCNKHDTELFKQIETSDIEFDDYSAQILLTYRTLMIEKRKKEIVIDWKTKILKSSTLLSHLPSDYFNQIEKSMIGDNLGVKDLEYLENLFLEDIKNVNNKSCNFFVFEMPRIEICCSSIFTYETSDEILFKSIIEKHKVNEPLTEVYFHLLPLIDKSIMIMGSLKSSSQKVWDFITDFINSDTNNLKKKISDLLICQVENWVCSPSFYINNCKYRESEINRLVKASEHSTNERRFLDFNLFEK